MNGVKVDCVDQGDRVLLSIDTVDGDSITLAFPEGTIGYVETAAMALRAARKYTGYNENQCFMAK